MVHSLCNRQVAHSPRSRECSLIADAATNRYRSEYTYDANGNIETVERYDADGTGHYDSFAYHYHTYGGRKQQNRLYQLIDDATMNTGSDIVTTAMGFDNTSTGVNVNNNYGYDALGNLVRDNHEDIELIHWTVAGKVDSIQRPSASSRSPLKFRYGASGQRVSKQVGDFYCTDPGAYREHYIRDAQGNIMATYRYTNNTGASLKLNERPLYGSSRLGSLRKEVELHTLASFDPASANPVQQVDLNYELTDHLGNVCAVVTGRLLDGNGGGTAKQAELVSAQGYEPFGAMLPGRNYSSGSYSYLFQGQEHDDELYGSVGTSYAFEYRMHDPRVGRFWSIDPLAADYPWNSPYAFSENRVIDAYELEGLEAVLVIDSDQRPQDNGTNGTSYSAEMYYLDESNGEVSGPYRASTYPNSISNTNNATTSRTANEGAHAYNNASGHKGGTRKGLNLVDANGNRNTPGTEPDGRAATMSYVNVHAGASNRGNYNSRGSEGCITICPDDAEAFFGNFNWTNTTQTKGNSEGTLTIVRADAIERATTLRTFQINAATLQSLTTAIGTRLTPRDIPEETRPAPEIPETR